MDVVFLHYQQVKDISLALGLALTDGTRKALLFQLSMGSERPGCFCSQSLGALDTSKGPASLLESLLGERQYTAVSHLFQPLRFLWWSAPIETPYVCGCMDDSKSDQKEISSGCRVLSK